MGRRSIEDGADRSGAARRARRHPGGARRSRHSAVQQLSEFLASCRGIRRYRRDAVPSARFPDPVSSGFHAAWARWHADEARGAQLCIGYLTSPGGARHPDDRHRRWSRYDAPGRRSSAPDRTSRGRAYVETRLTGHSRRPRAGSTGMPVRPSRASSCRPARSTRTATCSARAPSFPTRRSANTRRATRPSSSSSRCATTSASPAT